MKLIEVDQLFLFQIREGVCTYDIYVVHSRNGGHHDIEEERLTELEREWQKNNSILQMMVKSMSAKEWEKTRKEWLVPLGEGNYEIKGWFEVRF